jgi:hypothetical protein
MKSNAGSFGSIQEKIATLEEKKKDALQRLQRTEKAKEDGDQYYRGTELPIDDVIFSMREGLVKSLDITLDFYKKDLERKKESI